MSYMQEGGMRYQEEEDQLKLDNFGFDFSSQQTDNFGYQMMAGMDYDDYYAQHYYEETVPATQMSEAASNQ